MTIRRWLLIIVILGVAGSSFLVVTQKPPVFVSPWVSVSPTPIISSPVPTSSVHYGFLPYWNFKFLDTIQYDRLTHLAYFSVSTAADGHLIKTKNLGWSRFMSNSDQLLAIAREHRLKLDITLTAPNDQTLYDLLNDPAAQSNLVNQLVPLTSQYSLSGLNIDFEPLSASDDATATGFTRFIKTLRHELLPEKTLTIDIYPSAAVSVKIWELTQLVPYTNYFVVMTYDYYHPGSTQAGPIAPLYPAQPYDHHAVIKNLAQITHVIPREKVLLGIPTYGYEWMTQTSEWLSPASSSGALASFQRIQTLIDSGLPLNFEWNPLTLTPWLWFEQNHRIFQIHYDNSQSLALKSQIITDAGLGGSAIWALGYETQNTPSLP